MKIMKKIFKSRVLLVIVTVILTGSISVYAAGRYYATQVDYEPSNPNFNVDNMSDALDQLYDKTKNYKNLSTPTDVEANYLLNGKKAYKSNGTLVTGSIPIITAENRTLTSGENYTIPQGYHDGTGTVKAPNSVKTGSFVPSNKNSTSISLGFRPSNVIIRGNRSGYTVYFTVGDVGISGSDSNGWIQYGSGAYMTITNSGFNFVKLSDADTTNGCTLYYWAW